MHVLELYIPDCLCRLRALSQKSSQLSEKYKVDWACMAQSGAYRPPDYLLNSTLTYSLTLSRFSVGRVGRHSRHASDSITITPWQWETSQHLDLFSICSAG